jgi:hypothetical protein
MAITLSDTDATPVGGTEESCDLTFIFTGLLGAEGVKWPQMEAGSPVAIVQQDGGYK